MRRYISVMQRLFSPRSIFILLLVVVLYLISWIDCRWEQVLHIVGDGLLITVIIATPLCVYYVLRSIRRDKQSGRIDYSPALTLIIALIGTPLMIGICGYVLAIALNVLLPARNEPVIYQGRIVSKEIEEGKSTSYYLRLNETDSYGLALRLKVSPREYRAYEVGEHYRRNMQRGALGIDYNLRW